jgi:hypothetical protein
VKLNNIEYAMEQLDKLEKEINVDACAEVIQKNEPPPLQRQRRLDKYVFTIKIIEAEDLKACDLNGLSDPYVVLGDEYQKRLAKTRVIYGNLNPRWDETVDIVTTGPLNIIATIWDWDTLGDHDCVGRTSLKLDPSHFRDFMPREYWLDLDTQGRLLLRVSMEGERDDIQFYFGKAFRNLKRAERDMTRKVTDKLSAYIQHILSQQRLRGMLSKGISMQTAMNALSYFQRTRPPPPTPQGPTQLDITNALKPLFTYFDENFAIMKQTLTDSAMIMVMTRLWKEVLATIESLLVPPLSDKPSQQRPLSRQELDIVFKWLQVRFLCYIRSQELTFTYSFFSTSSMLWTKKLGSLTVSRLIFSSLQSTTNCKISTSSTSKPQKISSVPRSRWLLPRPHGNRISTATTVSVRHRHSQRVVIPLVVRQVWLERRHVATRPYC